MPCRVGRAAPERSSGSVTMRIVVSDLTARGQSFPLASREHLGGILEHPGAGHDDSRRAA